MGGILSGNGNYGGGILGPTQPDWAQKLGAWSAALGDAAAQFSGRPSPGMFQEYLAQQQGNQARQQILGALNSDDPAARQQAYSAAALMGIDTKPFQQQQAAAALPKLLQSMQPGSVPVARTSAPLPNLPGQTVEGGGFSLDTPGLGLSEALAQSGSPELQAQLAPKYIDSLIQQQADANKPFDLSPGQHRFGADGQEIASLPEKPNYNAAFNTDGTPNKAYQAYERGKIQTQQAPAWANYELAKQKMTAGIPDDATLHDMAVRYVNGDKTVATGMSRNAQMQTAFQRMISQVGHERGMSPEQISRNMQTFQAGTKAVQAFDTGKQGDTTRSLNVSVAHLNTLKDLGTALQNGDMTLINAAKQKFAEAFGVPAPTNFDAARAIVADEVAKGVIGGQTAQADREALAASLKRERSPQAINGAIGTFQNLLAGQLHGLRQQYKSSTGRDDFNDKLFPETISVLESSHQKPKGGPLPGAGQLPRLPSPQAKVRVFNPATGRLE